MSHRLILGPQRPTTNLGSAIAEAALPDGPIAVISAGWQEAEGDIDDVYELVQRPLVDLNLYHRAEEIFANDPRLHAAYRQRQDRLLDLQRLYRLRLRQLTLAARQIRRADAAPDLVAAEHRHAIAQLRALDRHQLNRIQAIYAEYESDVCPASSELLATHMAAIETELATCSSVLITGGNVAVLLNRLQLFDMGKLLSDRHIIAWSAGAMVLSDLIVLFHDKTPLGRRDPEVLGPGMGLLPGYIFLPDPKRRLKENDSVRMGLLHGRFSPARCITLDSGSQVRFEGDKVRDARGAGRLTRMGSVTGLLAS